jgi:nitroimidazol reductase NimA-like FMN-containing flavoprotein (pyridoxamine 5'-phosphate oxidase superfamily)
MPAMRRKDRAVTDPAKIRRILDNAHILHLGLVDEGRPYVVPLHYCYEYEGGDLTLYMHSARHGRKLDVISASPACFVELECDVALDDGGATPYKIACQYGSFYSSIMGAGTASIVEDADEKVHALKLLMRQQAGKDFPMNKLMAKTVAIIKVQVPASELSCKAHVRK